MAEDLKIGGRRVWMHKAIVAPDFKTEHVLSRDPWLYVELWLTREKLTKAASYWSQAKRFADASKNLSSEAAPLTLYYCYLNATKALLEAKGVSNGKHHGVGGKRPENARATLTNEIVNFQSGGVLPDLCAYLGESTQKHSYTLSDILWNIPFIHRAFRLTFPSSTDLFIPLEGARYVKNAGTSEAFFIAQVMPRFADGRMLTNIPNSFSSFKEADGKTFIRRKKRFCWWKGQTNALQKNGAEKRLIHYHGQTRRVVVNISGNRDLWYLKRHQPKNNVGMRHTIVLMFAAMHRLSELARYDLAGLDRHLAGKANWLLSEFIHGSADQFVDQIASEITGCQFWPLKVRQ